MVGICEETPVVRDSRAGLWQLAARGMLTSLEVAPDGRLRPHGRVFAPEDARRLTTPYSVQTNKFPHGQPRKNRGVENLAPENRPPPARPRSKKSCRDAARAEVELNLLKCALREEESARAAAERHAARALRVNLALVKLATQ